MKTLIPETWIEVTLGLLWTDARNGCGARCGAGRPTVVLRLLDLDTDGRIAPDGLREIPLTDDQRRKYALAPGDLLVFRVNGSPQIASKVIAYAGPPGFAYCDHFIRVRLDQRLALPGFVAKAVSTGKSRREIERGMVSTAGQHTVSQATLAEVHVPVPPVEEQRRIVDALDSYLSRLDDAVASLERVQAKLKG